MCVYVRVHAWYLKKIIKKKTSSSFWHLNHKGNWNCLTDLTSLFFLMILPHMFTMAHLIGPVRLNLQQTEDYYMTETQVYYDFHKLKTAISNKRTFRFYSLAINQNIKMTWLTPPFTARIKYKLHTKDHY